MAQPRLESLPNLGAPSQVLPMLCLLGVVALLSSITPTVKYVYQHSGLNFLDVASGRIVIGFLFLAAITASLDWRGLRALRLSECTQLGTVGALGVGSYAVAAWGLMHTSVTHYALVYSLLPTFTALFSWGLGKDRPSLFSLLGILLSWIGCVIALFPGFEAGTIGFGMGDAFVLLFTAMMAAHIVLSAPIVRRHGLLTANTAMFGTSALLVSGCSVAWGSTVPHVDVSWDVWGAVFFIGLGTAGVFLLRCQSLKTLTPATVGAYHNLIPIATIILAHVSLDEPLTTQTMIGACAVVLGTEVVRRAHALGLWFDQARRAQTSS